MGFYGIFGCFPEIGHQFRLLGILPSKNLRILAVGFFRILVNILSNCLQILRDSPRFFRHFLRILQDSHQYSFELPSDSPKFLEIL